MIKINDMSDEMTFQNIELAETEEEQINIKKRDKFLLGTPAREKFAVALANGKTQVDAAIEAGYSMPAVNKPSLPSKLAGDPRIQHRVREIIRERSYDDLSANVWTGLLTQDTSELDAGSLKWKNVIEMKLRAIDQIAKLGGWEPAKQEESKKLIVHSDLRAMLPASKS